LKGKAAHAASVLFSAPLIFPQVLLGVALFLFYARLNISLNIFSLALGHLLIATPYVIRSVSAGLSGIDERLVQAAQNLGASPMQAFFLVTLPLLKSGILSGAVFAFIVSFSDINLAIFLSAAGNTTLPMQILAQMQFVSDPTIAAAATAQIAIVSVLVIIAQKFTGTAR
jgi:putative spermidine/putrescine transport system permease protein